MKPLAKTAEDRYQAGAGLKSEVILNLVLNAVEAMSQVEAGPRELLISTEKTQAKGVLVTVRDSGPGIDPERIERVFEAFYSTKSSGMGMGLSICRSIKAPYFSSPCPARKEAHKFSEAGAHKTGEPHDGMVYASVS